MARGDWSGPRPSPDDLRKMWGRLQFRVEPYDPAPFDPYLRALREVYVNGGALLHGFTVPEDLIFDWYPLGRNTLDTSYGDAEGLDFFTRFLGSAAVRDAAPELQVPEPLRLPQPPGQVLFQWGSALMFEGGCAQVLFQGGAYRRFPGTAAEAKRLAREFSAGLMGDRYEDVLVYHASKAWTPWFGDVAWDGTSVLFDKGTRRLWLFCYTDTD